MTQIVPLPKPTMKEPTIKMPRSEPPVRSAVAAKLAQLLDRDDAVVIATTLAGLVARHTRILFQPEASEGCEGLAARATDAVRADLDRALARCRTDGLPGPSRSGQKRLADHAGRLIQAFHARGAVIEERTRRERLRALIVAAAAELAEAAALDPDIVTLASARLDLVLASAVPFYGPVEHAALASRARQALGDAAAGALLESDPGQAVSRLRKQPFPHLLGSDESARLADLATRLAPAAAEDAQYRQDEIDAHAALQSAAQGLATVLRADARDPLSDPIG
ncbi:MAG: hypothetical protein U1E97_02710 [Alphaproteobacteria bacterium]